MDTVMLVDGRNFVFRHHFTHSGLATQDGRPTSVLHGCLTGLLALSNRMPDIPIVFVWDGGGKTWRHKLLSPSDGQNTIQQIVASKEDIQKIIPPSFGKVEALKPTSKPEGYKATRDLISIEAMDSKRMAIQQIPEFIRILEILGIRNFKVKSLEGDDLIGILATAILQRKIFERVIIHSTDKDFYQLISKDISVLKGLEKGGKLDWARREEIPLKYGIQVEEWVKYRAITGDTSDNIPNFLTGVGPVTAVKWLRMGLDPSLKKYDDLPYLAKLQLKSVKMPRGKGALIDWAALWERLHKHYICSQILVDGKYDILPEDLREGVSSLIGRLTKKSFIRMSATEERYRQLSEKLAYWELAELLGQRDSFRNLR